MHIPRAFRIIDLLAVVGIVAVGLGVLIPALMTDENRGRRPLCQNNMRNIGLGLVQYYTAKGFFPSAGTFFDDPAFHQGDPLKSNIYTAMTNPAAFAMGPNPCRASWVVIILPYLDQQDLYNAWNFNQSYLNTASPAAELVTLGAGLQGIHFHQDPRRGLGVSLGYQNSPNVVYLVHHPARDTISLVAYSERRTRKPSRRDQAPLVQPVYQPPGGN